MTYVTMFKLLHFILSLPITIYCNFKVFPFNIACRLPFLVDYKTRVMGLKKNCIEISNPRFACVKYGWGYGSLGNNCNSINYLIFRNTKCNHGCIIFKGRAQFAVGVTLRIDNGGTILFGDHFTANQNFSCFSNTSIKFGDNCAAGWNVNVRDSDGHAILDDNGNTINPNRKISIGNHVWMASHCDILKGTKVSDDSIIGFKTLVSRQFEQTNVIIAGCPGKIIKENINWKA